VRKEVRGGEEAVEKRVTEAVEKSQKRQGERRQ
jgi:hypothetical protein